MTADPRAPKASAHRIAKHFLAVGSAVTTTLVVLCGFIYFYLIYPSLQAGPEQPIPFSHRLHAGIKEIDCQFCHNTVEEQRNAGMPPVEKCLFCHQHIIPEHPAVQLIHDHLPTEESEGDSIPWVKVTYLPDHVYFSHQQHITAGLECAECHGPVEEMDRVYEQNRLLMGFCVNCHREQDRELQPPILDCWNCHQ